MNTKSHIESRSPLKGDTGITLIEVLAAMIILSVGILAMAPMMVLSIHANGEANDLTLATTQAQSLLEQLKEMNPLPPVPYDDIVVDTANMLTSYVSIDNSASDASVPAGMNRLQVIVKWTDKAGVARSFEYSTFRHD